MSEELHKKIDIDFILDFISKLSYSYTPCGELHIFICESYMPHGSAYQRYRMLVNVGEKVDHHSIVCSIHNMFDNEAISTQIKRWMDQLKIPNENIHFVDINGDNLNG